MIQKDTEKEGMLMLRKAMLLGLGAVTMTKEALEKAVDELVKKGELSQEEAKEAIRDLWAKGQQERENLTKTVREQVDKAMSKFAVVSREEFAAVLARLEVLEEKLGDQAVGAKEQFNNQPETDPDEGEKE
jgi:polyhydroxyalkanoate synthesis regulator phasin